MSDRYEGERREEREGVRECAIGREEREMVCEKERGERERERGRERERERVRRREERKG